MRLEVVNGCFAYPQGAVLFKDINFLLNEGEMVTVLGRNGVGKTTLLKCIMGILRWKNGFLKIDGEPVENAIRHKGIAYVPQAHSYAYEYSVREIVMMGRTRNMGMMAIPSKDDYVRADEALQKVGLYDLRERKCSQLSGGQLQMVFIARALVSDPRIIILDEPESHLDFYNQSFLLELLMQLSEEEKVSMIMNTHYPEHALRFNGKSLLMNPEESCFGDTKRLLTTENIENYFGVSAMIDTMTDGRHRVPVFAVTGRCDTEKMRRNGI